MSDEMRRAILQGIAESDDASGHERLRALELLDRLDEREQASSEPPWEQPVERDPDRLGRAIDILVTSGSLHAYLSPIIEARVAAELRERFSVVVGEGDESAADEPEVELEVAGPTDASEAVSGPETASPRSQALRNPPPLRPEAIGAPSEVRTGIRSEHATPLRRVHKRG